MNNLKIGIVASIAVTIAAVALLDKSLQTEEKRKLAAEKEAYWAERIRQSDIDLQAQVIAHQICQKRIQEGYYSSLAVELMEDFHDQKEFHKIALRIQE